MPQKDLHPNRRRTGQRCRRPDDSGSRASQRQVHPDALLHGRTHAPSAPAGCAWWRFPAVGRLLPACTTPVQDGMSVTTNSPKLTRYRRIALELLLVERNHFCSVCVSNGHCELQALAQSLGVTNVRFPYNYPKLPVDLSHERFVLDHNRCILCTRCVRVCAEVEGAHVWDVTARGIQLADRERTEPALGRGANAAPVAASACRRAPPARWRRRAGRWKRW